MRFTVYWAKDGWRWRLKARNGRIVADSGEAYTSRKRCIAAADRLRDPKMAVAPIEVDA